MTGHVVFRADSAVQIGSGHIMRCLSLADVLVAKGWRCTFLTRARTGHIADLITKRGHDLSLMPAPASPIDGWLGIEPGTERVQASTALARLAADWVVLDHYGLDAEWTQQTVPHGVRVLVIDDLANRPQNCDLLLDQTPDRNPGEYDGQVASRTPLLLGAGFALLHSRFTEMRAKQRPEHGSKGVGHVLLALGGMDADNITGAVIDRIKPLVNSIGLTHLDVALGHTAPNIAAVRNALDAFPVSNSLQLGSPQMASLMAHADMAIGAGGTMAWERCCLGLPTIALCIAENQRGGLRALSHAGAALVLPDIWQEELGTALLAMSDPETRFAMSTRAAAMVDGLGCARVHTAMQAVDLHTRTATKSDAMDVFHWRMADHDPTQTLSGHVPSIAEHIAWFDSALENGSRHLLMIQDADGPIGHVRLDMADPEADAKPLVPEARVSITLNPERRGKGLGASVLWSGMVHGLSHGIRRFNAEIHNDNIPSQRIFAQLGFTCHGTTEHFGLYQADYGGPGVPSLATEI